MTVRINSWKSCWNNKMSNCWISTNITERVGCSSSSPDMFVYKTRRRKNEKFSLFTSVKTTTLFSSVFNGWGRSTVLTNGSTFFCEEKRKHPSSSAFTSWLQIVTHLEDISRLPSSPASCPVSARRTRADARGWSPTPGTSSAGRWRRRRCGSPQDKTS